MNVLECVCSRKLLSTVSGNVIGRERRHVRCMGGGVAEGVTNVKEKMAALREERNSNYGFWGG
jgi:hypothetical protein